MQKEFTKNVSSRVLVLNSSRGVRYSKQCISESPEEYNNKGLCTQMIGYRSMGDKCVQNALIVCLSRRQAAKLFSCSNCVIVQFVGSEPCSAWYSQSRCDIVKGKCVKNTFHFCRPKHTFAKFCSHAMEIYLDRGTSFSQVAHVIIHLTSRSKTAIRYENTRTVLSISLKKISHGI